MYCHASTSTYDVFCVASLISSFSSYKALHPKTRLVIGVAVMLNASAMLLFSDQIESALGVSTTSEEQQKLFKVYQVERETKG